jgi:hypothetical protein
VAELDSTMSEVEVEVGMKASSPLIRVLLINEYRLVHENTSIH